MFSIEWWIICNNTGKCALFDISALTFTIVHIYKAKHTVFIIKYSSTL